MKRSVAFLTMAGLLAAAALYNVKARQGAGLPPPVATAAETVSLVEAATIEEAPTFQELELLGTITPENRAAISSKVPARIVSVEVQNGDRVRAGQPLARLDMGDMAAQIRGLQAAADAARAQVRKAENGLAARRTELDDAVAAARSGVRFARSKLDQAQAGQKLSQAQANSDAEQAELEVRAAEAGLKQAETAYRQAADLLKRSQLLHEKGGLPKADLEGAEAQARIAEGQLEAAKSGLERAKRGAAAAQAAAPLRDRVSKADTEAAQEGLRRAEEGLATALSARESAMRIARADIDSAKSAWKQAVEGLAQARAQIGAATLASPIAGVVTERNAQPGDYAQPGFPLMRIVDTNRLRAEFAVPVTRAGSIEVGSPIRVFSPSSRRWKAMCRVTGTERVTTADSRTVTISARLPAATRMTAGETVTGRLQIALPAGAKLVPLQAVVRRASEETIFVIRENRARTVRIRVVAEIGGNAAVEGSLRSGDLVIRSAGETLEDGMPVNARAEASR